VARIGPVDLSLVFLIVILKDSMGLQSVLDRYPSAVRLRHYSDLKEAKEIQKC